MAVLLEAPGQLPPALPVCGLLALQLAAQHRQTGGLQRAFAAAQGVDQDLQIVQLTEMRLGLTELLNEGLQGGLAPRLQMFEGIAGRLDAFAQIMQGLRGGILHRPASVEKQGGGEGCLPVVKPGRQGKLAQAGEAGTLLPFVEAGQELEVAGAVQGLLQRVEGLAPVTDQAFHRSLQSLLFVGGKPWQ